jgi:hypothetical protein
MADTPICTVFFPTWWTKQECLNAALKARFVNLFWIDESTAEVWRIAPRTVPKIKLERFNDNKMAHTDSALAEPNEMDLETSQRFEKLIAWDPNDLP